MNGLVGQDEQIVFLKANINNLSRQIEFKHLIVGLDLKESDSVPVLGDNVLLVGEKVSTHHPSEIVQGPVFNAAILQYCYLAEVPSLSKISRVFFQKVPGRVSTLAHLTIIVLSTTRRKKDMLRFLWTVLKSLVWPVLLHTPMSHRPSFLA